jgi:hypothetical protein
MLCSRELELSAGFFRSSLAESSQGFARGIGSRDAPQIALDDVGRAIAFAPDPLSRRQKQIEAFFRIAKFKRVFDSYGGSNGMPDGEFVSNVLLGPRFWSIT